MTTRSSHPARRAAAVAFAAAAAYAVVASAFMAPAAAQQGPLTADQPSQGRQDPMTRVAVERLKAMSDYLGAAKGLSVEIDTMFDEPLPSGIAVKRITLYKIKLKRPDKLFFETVLDDGASRLAWFDGKRLVVASPDEKSYLEIPFDGTVDELISSAAAAGLGLPVADFFRSDAFGSLAPTLISGADLGERQIGDGTVRQIAFESFGSNWQLWLSTGGKPLPVRLVSVYVRRLGDPEFLAVFDDWSLEVPPDAAFEPKLGADWKKIEPGPPPTQPQ